MADKIHKGLLPTIRCNNNLDKTLARIKGPSKIHRWAKGQGKDLASLVTTSAEIFKMANVDFNINQTQEVNHLFKEVSFSRTHTSNYNPPDRSQTMALETMAPQTMALETMNATNLNRIIAAHECIASTNTISKE